MAISDEENKHKEYMKEYMKEYHKKNKERLKEYRSRPEVKERRRKTRSKPEIKEHEKIKKKEYRSRPENMKKEREKQNEYRAKNVERIRKRDNAYRSRPEVNKKRREQKRQAYSRLKPEVKEKMLAKNRAYFKEYYAQPKIKQKYSKVSNSLKLEVFTHYSKMVSNSDIPICACCGYDDLRFLALDHIVGRKHLPPNETNLNGILLWKYVKVTGFKEGFQVLCYNCNIAKGPRRYCPHQLDRNNMTSR